MRGGHRAPAPVERPRGVRTKSAWLVAVPFLVLARPSPGVLAWGGAMTLAGLLLRGWAAGTIRKDRVLTTTGPYAHLRHPLYAGSFLIGMGLAVAGGDWIWPALVAVFFAGLYRRTLAEERLRLASLFGERYDSYVARVPGFVPRLTPYRPPPERDRPEGAATAGAAPVGGAAADAGGERPSEPGFAWGRYVRNREWEALLGVVGALGLLAAKARWLG